MVASWIIQILIVIVLNVAAALLRPKPKQPKPDAVKDLEDPTAEAGRPIPKVFGRVTVKSVNVLFFGQKSSNTFDTKA